MNHIKEFFTHCSDPKSHYHWRYLPSWAVLGVMRLLCFMPYKCVIRVGWLIGLLLNRFLKERKRIAYINISRCLPHLSESQHRQLTEETMVNTGIGLAESMFGWWAPQHAIDERVSYTGLEKISEAQATGRGVIILSGHFTPLELCGRMLGSATDLHLTYRSQNNLAFNHCMTQARAARYGTPIEKKEMRKMLKALKSGGVVWYANDQDFGKKDSVIAPFFGIPTYTLATMSKLLKMTNAVVLYSQYHRDDSQGLGKASYHIDILSPFEQELSKDPADDVDNATRMNQVVEDSAKLFPSQYYWVHKRFKKKTQKTDPAFYAK